MVLQPCVAGDGTYAPKNENMLGMCVQNRCKAKPEKSLVSLRRENARCDLQKGN
jgi:hypothetical protein